MHERKLSYFQPDKAAVHTTNSTIHYFEEFSGKLIISIGLWPPRSSDLTPLDFHLSGLNNNFILKNKIHKLEALEATISQDFQHIVQDELQCVFNALKRRANLC